MLLVLIKDLLTYHSVLLRLLRSSSTSGWRLCLSAVLRCLSEIPTRPPPDGNTRILASGRSYIDLTRGGKGASRPLPLAVAQSVFHSVCHWLHIHSPLATMNPHRPGGGPRQHYRPDGSRRRTAGELAKRAAKAAARAAAAAAGAAGGGAAKPAGPVVADAGASAGVLCQPRFRSPRPSQGSCQPRHQLQPRLLLQPRPRQLPLDLHMAPTPIECSTRHPALQLALSRVEMGNGPGCPLSK